MNQNLSVKSVYSHDTTGRRRTAKGTILDELSDIDTVCGDSVEIRTKVLAGLFELHQEESQNYSGITHRSLQTKVLLAGNVRRFCAGAYSFWNNITGILSCVNTQMHLFQGQLLNMNWVKVFLVNNFKTIMKNTRLLKWINILYKELLASLGNFNKAKEKKSVKCVIRSSGCNPFPRCCCVKNKFNLLNVCGL